MKKRIKVIHVGYYHRFDDVRILRKECVSLVQSGYDVTFVTSDRNGTYNNKELLDVKIEIIPLKGRRFIRYFLYKRKLLEFLLNADGDIYHVHEASLISVALKLIKKGKKVIYDMHEDSPSLLSTTATIAYGRLAGVIAKKYVSYRETKLVKRANHVFHVSDLLEERLHSIGVRNCTGLYNYPIIEESIIYSNKKNQICYIGGISEQRGITNLIKVMEHLDCELKIAGKVPSGYLNELSKLPGFKKTEFLGFLDKNDILKLLSESLLGMCTLKYTANHYHSMPVKLFEYMNASIPVVSSNFPVMKKIVEGSNCGICVDPNSIEEIVAGIHKILGDDSLRLEMGENGFEAIQTKYNWNNEEKKLVSVYDTLTKEIRLNS